MLYGVCTIVLRGFTTVQYSKVFGIPNVLTGSYGPDACIIRTQSEAVHFRPIPSMALALFPEECTVLRRVCTWTAYLAGHSAGLLLEKKSGICPKRLKRNEHWFTRQMTLLSGENPRTREQEVTSQLVSRGQELELVGQEELPSLRCLFDN